MCYSNFLEKKISINDLIYIDTCSAMKIDRFIPFVESIKVHLKNYNKKITILGTVHEELKDKTRSEYFDVKIASCKALSYIYDNSEYFKIRENTTGEKFADPEIQRIMLDERRKKKLLLISNDCKLTTFVFNLNNNEAVNGFYINVCYLEKDGELCMCDCVKNRSFKEIENHQEREIKVIKEVVEKTVVKTVEKKKTLFEKCAIPTGCFFFGIGTACLSPMVYRFVKGYVTA